MTTRAILILLALATAIVPYKPAESFIPQLRLQQQQPRCFTDTTVTHPSSTLCNPKRHTSTTHQQQHHHLYNKKKLAPSEVDRLLLTEPAQTAFITAEMQSFLTDMLVKNDQPSGHLTRWTLSNKDLQSCNLIDENGAIVNKEYLEAKQLMSNNDTIFITTKDSDGNDGTVVNTEISVGGKLAIDTLCNTTRLTFQDGFTNQPGLLSALGSAICYFRDAFRTGTNLAACERIGVSDYTVAHHITDMYHHRNFRGAYTKTLTPYGSGEIAARAAVGLIDEITSDDGKTAMQGDNVAASILDEDEDEDECILWSPTTEGVCIHWKSEDEAWRKKRFERIQMEGTKDPRRGGSGTTR